MDAVFDTGSVDGARTRTPASAARRDGSPGVGIDDGTDGASVLFERRPASILAMQRAAGNHAVASALGSGTRDRVADPSKPRPRSRSDCRADDGGSSRRPPADGAALTVQRSLKFEFQTANTVWAVKNTGSADPQRLPRKYAATSRGYGRSASQERGDRPAYLAVGQSGGPARKKGDVVFEEARGQLVTEERRAGRAPLPRAQFLRVYRFTRRVRPAALVGKPVKSGQLTLSSEVDRAALPGAAAVERGTFEFRYQNSDGTDLDLHLDSRRRFRAGHQLHVRVRRGPSGVDSAKAAQFLEIWKVTITPRGTVRFGNDLAELARASVVDNSKRRSMRGKYNAGTYHRTYYQASDVLRGKPIPGAKELRVHLDEENRLSPGTIQFLRRKRLAAAEEQSAIEVQSETGGVLEFETPKWFRDWTELEERIQEAHDITQAFNDPHQSAPVTNPAVVDPIRTASGSTKPIVEWPAAFSTAHLTRLRADRRRLVVQIVDPTWRARIQASEAVALGQYESLLRQHERPDIATIALTAADAIFAALTARAHTIEPSRLGNLRGFVQLVATYLARGQLHAAEGRPAKFSFRLMARTDFASMYQSLLSAEERRIFRSLVDSRSDPILTELAPLINAELSTRGNPAIAFERSTRFFAKEVGESARTVGPSVHAWLRGITKGKDLLSGEAISDAMGAKKVTTSPGDKDFRRAQFEIRGSVMPGGIDIPAAGWVAFAKKIFDSALVRAADTPDDPTTPRVDESSRTGLEN